MRTASSLTLGMFLWSDNEDFAHREIDIEAGRWGQAHNDDIQFVLQPHNAPDNMLRFAVAALSGPSVHEFTWTSGCVDFQTSNGSAVIKRFAVPPPGSKSD